MTSNNFLQKLLYTVLGISILIILYITSLTNYLLFHAIIEMFCVVVAFGIFVIAWNTNSFVNNSYLIFIGTAYLCVGSIDLFHMLSYKGMGLFHTDKANIPTQLWIAARYIEAISLLIGPFLSHKISSHKSIAINKHLIFTIYSGIFIFIILSVCYWQNFPNCFIEDKGLTNFKIITEYIIVAILVLAIASIYKNKQHFDPLIFKMIIISTLFTIGAEILFTFYISVYGISNMIGHLFKLISFYLIYKAFVETGLKQPYAIIFRDLKLNEEQLTQERDKLEQALKDINQLSGLLPICASCKKIRDDKGYWNQLEAYIINHSEAQFSHGICPDCAKKLYPELYEQNVFE